MKIEIQALEMSMTSEELKSYVSPEELQKLKGKGVLQAYILAQEGISQPKILQEGTTVLTWTKQVIKNLLNKVKKGTQFFIGHGADNSHENRNSVGTIISSIIKEVSGKLSNIIIGYFPEKEKVDNLDICSMEAEIEIDNNVVVGVDQITGIALGSSDTDNPAFPGAFRLNSIQCFGKETEKKNPEKEHIMTFEELKRALRDMNVHPWQLFTMEDLKNDKVFGKIFDEKTDLEDKYKALETKHKELETQNTEAMKGLNKTKAKEWLDKELKEGFTDKQKAFIEKRFNPDSLEDITEKTISEYVVNAKKEFSETAKLFGIEDAVDNKGNKKNEENNKEDKTPEEEALELIGVKE